MMKFSLRLRVVPLVVAFTTLLTSGCEQRVTPRVDAAEQSPPDAEEGAAERPNFFPGFVDAPVAADQRACVKVSCDVPGGRYCGEIGDGCGGAINCGGCPVGLTCGGGGTPGVCSVVIDLTNCKKLTCEQPSGRYCGKIGDRCGGALDCAGCSAGETCGGGGTPGICGKPVDPATCKAITCQPTGGQFCGTVGDGCGHVLDCGNTCPNGTTCGGAGTPNLCGAGANAACKPIVCAQAGGDYCGKVGDGCGRILDCGDCIKGKCGEITPSICSVPVDASCKPNTCEYIGGTFCGKIGDGCGKALECGGCNGGKTCVNGACVLDTCENLCKKQMLCPNGGDTTVTGVVLAPTPPAFGVPDPIYNAVVYVPNAPVIPFKAGVACETCEASVTGAPLVSAISGADGTFTLKNVPVGDNIPLVIQIGRWRRQVTIPKVAPCTVTTLPAELTRLPRNKAEGDIPLTAIASGKVDVLECVLRKIGIDDAEFTPPGAGGRVQMFQANGAVLAAKSPPSADLTKTTAALSPYDLVLFPCEGAPVVKDVAASQNLVKYSDIGGRIFFTHYSYTWMHKTPPFMDTATWAVEGPHPQDPLVGTIDQSFPKGKAFADWLLGVKATAPMPGQIQISVPRNDLTAVLPPAQRWISSVTPKTVQHYTFNTPLKAAADKQCGRVVFSDFHVNNIAETMDTKTFPTECAPGPLSAQEKVLEFMLFDLASCVQPDARPPAPPMPPPAPPGPPAAPPVPPPAAPPAPPPAQPPAAPPVAPVPPPPVIP